MQTEDIAPDCSSSESAISEVLELMPCVVFVFRLTGNRSAAMPHATSKLSDLVGLDPQDVVRDAAPFLSRMDAGDIERFFAAGDNSARSMATWHMEFRFDHPSKNKVWIEWRATPVQRQGQLVWQGFMCDVTERKQSELAMLRSKQAYRNLVESSPDFVIRYDLDQRIRYLNAKLARELNLSSADEVLGLHPIDVWPDGRFAAIDEAAGASRKTSEEVTVELKVIEDDGSTGYRQILVVPEWDENGRPIGTLAFGRDITEFKQLQLQLSEHNAFQASLLNAINEVGMQLMVIENERIIHIANRRLANEFGYRAAEIDAGIPFIDIVHPEERARVMDLHRRRLAGDKTVPGTYEFALQTKQGERREYETSVALVPGSDPPRVISIGKDVTARKRAERELLLLQQAVNQSSDPLYITDSTTMNFNIVNDAACRSLGYSREELQSMSVAEIDPNFSLERAKQTIMNSEVGRSRSFETQHRRKDGSIFPVEISGAFFMSGGIRFSIAFSRDITERKRTENTLRFIAHNSGERHFLAALALHLSEAIGAAVVVIDRLSEKSDDAETVVFCADGTIVPNIRHALSDIPGDHFTDSGGFYPEGMQARLPRGSLLADIGIDSFACFPLHDSTGKPIGRIAVMDSAPFWEEAAVMQLLQIVAPRAAAELERAESDRQLRLHEQEFRSLAENSPDNIIRYDRECRQIYANPSVVETLMALLGRNPMGETPNQAYPDGSFGEYEAALKRVIATGRMEDLEIMLPDRGDGVQYHMIRMAAERNLAGEVIGVVAFGRDVTAIREGERRLQHFVDSLPGLAYTFRLSPDGRGSFLYVSPGVEAMYGLRPEEAEGDMSTIHNRAHPEDRPRIEAAIAESARTLSPFHVDFRINHPDLPLRWLEVRSTPELQADGSLIWYGIMLDITETKVASEKLKQAHEFSEKLINALPDPLFVKDRQHRWIMVNDAFSALLGQPLSEIIGKTDYDYLPAEQADIFWEMDDKVFTSGDVNINDETIVDAEGNQLSIQTKKTLVGSDTLIGVIRDLTQARLAEAELRANEEKLRGLYELAPMGIALTDMQGHYLEFNDAFRDICGYSREELNQLDYWALTPKEYAEQEAEQLESLKTHGSYGPYEKEYICKSGSRIPLRLSGALIHDHNGEPYIWSIVEDITERRQTETKLRMAASVFEAATEGITITDPAGRILDTNPAFTRISGFTHDEVLGKRPSILASGRHDLAFYQTMWQQVLGAGSWSGEIINRRKNGELYTEQLNIVTVNDESGNTKYYIGIFSDISLLKQHEQHLQHIAHHDDLTGLPNRLLLTDRLSHAIAQARRNDQMLAILYLDIDGFKPINDNHGHELGDRVLVEIAQRFLQSLRASDTVARIGGDEFVILLAGVSDMRECEFTAHRLLEMISRPILLEGHSLDVTASIGICIYPNDAQDDADTLLRYADQAMYTAKNAGRNQFVFYDSLVQRNAWSHSQTIYDLRQALKKNQLSVHYQPIIELGTGRITMAEALARWHHPVRGMVPPSEFIPAAENGGLIHEIGDLVFGHAAGVAQTWNNRQSQLTGTQLSISVNYSPRQFINRDGINDWKRILDEKGVSAELLSLEITEDLLLDDRAEVIQQLMQLRALGMAISIDDFGTGYSSLSDLKKFNIGYIKIDRSIIRGIVDDPDNCAIVESIIVMAKRLGIRTIAEGVETREQDNLLRKAGCDMAQGFFIAKPMPETEFLAFVARAR